MYATEGIRAYLIDNYEYDANGNIINHKESGRYTEKTKEEKKEKMERTTNESIEAVRESYTLVNKSSLLSLTKTVALCLLENINMNKKTEIEPS